MKSLVALLDRKKKANTLLPTPLSSSLPPSDLEPAIYERGYARSNVEHVSSSSYLRPPGPYRVASNPNMERHPYVPEPATLFRAQSPAHSVAYHNDSDDDMLADPFAAPPGKPRVIPPRSSTSMAGFTSDPLPTATIQDPSKSRRASQCNDVRQKQGSSSIASSVANQTSGANSVDGGASKTRRLRERRSFSSFLRSQAIIPAASVPRLPPAPISVPERRTSFFQRGRSGSTSVAKGGERTHTSHHAPVPSAPVSAQPRTPAPSGIREIEGKGAQVGTQAPATHSPATPDSWVRVGGITRDQSVPNSPTHARRRALSVPATRQPTPTDPSVPPVPQHLLAKSSASESVPEGIPPILRPDMRTRLGRDGHNSKSASVSVASDSHNVGCGPLETSLRRQPSLKHIKQASISTSEGGHNTGSSRIARKSALKRTSIPVRQGPPTRHDNRATATTISGSEPALLQSTPLAEGSLKRVGAEVTKNRRAVEIITTSADKTIVTPKTPSTYGNSGSISDAGGRTSAPGDSRALPVLDNIWGSFVSETAFGSLPPSPGNSTIRRAPQKQADGSSSIRRRHWNSDSIPPTSPPVVDLPPVPKELSPTMPLSLGPVPRRKMSRREMLLTPPISPAEELEVLGFGTAMSTSVSDGSLLSLSRNSPSSTSPKLLRSASSPVTQTMTNLRRDVEKRSWLSITPTHTRPMSPSSTSRSSSQCTPTPGTPVGSQISTAGRDLTRFEQSSGASKSSFAASYRRIDHVGVPERKEREPSPPSMPTGDSQISLSMFPTVPLGLAQQEGKFSDEEHTESQRASWSEESLLTPPVTPAWFAQVFDKSTKKEQGWTEAKDTSEMSLTQLGSLARIRRQKHVFNAPSSSSNESSTEPDMLLPLTRRENRQFREKHMGSRI